MRRVLKITFALTLVALIMAASCVCAFAAKEEITVNGATAEVGDIVTYSLNLSDCTENVEGLQMYVVYDSKSLKLDEDSLEFPKLNGVVSNTKLENIITFNWTDVQNTADFKKKGAVMKASFKVLKEGVTDITYFVSELYGHDLTYLKSFTFTNDIAVNGKTVVKNASPVVCREADVINEYQGSFTNYPDGKGEKNGSGKNAIIGVTHAPTTAAATEVTKGGPGDVTTIITILVVVLIVLAIVVLAVLRRHFAKGEDNEAEKKNPDKKEKSEEK